MSIVVMLNFARSGGTVLARCLGCLPDVMILSEVNALAGGETWNTTMTAADTLREQAKRWYEIELGPGEFADVLVEMEQVCSAREKRLLFRDWPYVNFHPHEVNDQKPPGRLLSLEALKGRTELIPFAFVRDAIDVYISHSRPLTPSEFFGYYLTYVHEVIRLGCPIYKYEDFCRNPGGVLQAICRYTGIRFTEDYRNFQRNERATGDVQLGRQSRGIRQGKIRPLKRRRVAPNLVRAINRSVEMIEANRLLNYPTRFGGWGLFT